MMGSGLPGPGQASLIAAGALAGEGKLNVGIVAAIAWIALVFGSYAGYSIGAWKGRRLLDRQGPPLEKTRRKLLAKGDKAFGHGTVTFFASATLPSFLPGIFHVRFYYFMLVSASASICWTIMYVGLSYFFGAEIAHHIASAGTNAILAVVVLVAVGLGLRFGWSRWRAKRQERPGNPHDQATPVSSGDKTELVSPPAEVIERMLTLTRAGFRRRCPVRGSRLVASLPDVLGSGTGSDRAGTGLPFGSQGQGGWSGGCGQGAQPLSCLGIRMVWLPRNLPGRGAVRRRLEELLRCRRPCRRRDPGGYTGP